MRPSAASTSALAVVLALCGYAHALLDYYQKMDGHTTYYIYNAEYPGNYAPGTQSRWRLSTATGSRIEISCKLELPSSTNCQDDRVLISLSGDDSLSDAHTYCGYGNISLVTDANHLIVVLNVSNTSDGGRFLCGAKTLSSPSCKCGMKKQSRIVGGQETGVNEFPFMAGLLDLVATRLYCGATIVSNRWALTAAQCVTRRDVSQIGLLVGEHDTAKGNETAATALYSILSIRVHPQYGQPRAGGWVNDIALVQVDGKIATSEAVIPACLPFRYYTRSFTGSKVEVTGWGTVEFTGHQSQVLMKADQHILSPEKCAAVYGSKVTYNQICSFNPGKGACQMDSGGPLFWEDPDLSRTFVIGVVGSINGCVTDKADVNTRVTAYLQWIYDVMKDDDTLCSV